MKKLQIAAAALAAGFMSVPASAAAFDSSVEVQCAWTIEEPCRNMNFIITLAGATEATTAIDFNLTGEGWKFLNDFPIMLGHSDDGWGPNFWEGIVSADGLSLPIEFPLGTAINPYVLVQFEFAEHRPDTSTLAFTYRGYDANRTVMFEGSFGNVVPEPATWVMMLGGFAGAGLALRRGRRTRRLAAA